MILREFLHWNVLYFRTLELAQVLNQLTAKTLLFLNVPRSITKPDGRVIELASFGAIKSAFSGGAQVLDVRDKNEVDANKGGTTVTTAVHVPVNMNGESQ